MLIDDPKDAPAASSPADTKTQDVDDGALDAEGNEVAPDGPLHKSERWKQVLAKSKQLDELGDPLDVRARLARLDYYDSLVANMNEDRTSSEPKTKEQKDAEAELADAYKALLKVAPEVQDIQAMRQEMRLFWEGIIDAAEDATVDAMKDAGMPTEAKDVKAMSEVLQSIIKEDRKLHLRFRRDPEGAVKKAFDRFSTTFSAGKRSTAASTQRDKQKLTTLPKPVGSSGSAPGGDKFKPPANLKEADAAAKEFFKQYTG